MDVAWRKDEPSYVDMSNSRNGLPHNGDRKTYKKIWDKDWRLFIEYRNFDIPTRLKWKVLRGPMDKQVKKPRIEIGWTECHSLFKLDVFYKIDLWNLIGSNAQVTNIVTSIDHGSARMNEYEIECHNTSEKVVYTEARTHQDNRIWGDFAWSLYYIWEVMKEWEIQGLEDVEWDQQKVLKCRLDLLNSLKMYVQGPQIRPLRAD